MVLVTIPLFSGCDDDVSAPLPVEEVDVLTFQINLNDRSNDRFKVKVIVPQLSADDTIFQFAATAPGTYATADIGRFIRNFKAYDKDGVFIHSEKIDTNQWDISEAENVRWIEYTARDTWDTLLTEDPISLMTGTSLEDDHALFNAYCVIGYPFALEDEPMRISFATPDHWKTGTALTKDGDGYYQADDFEHLVDSPFLFGDLTVEETNVGGTTVAVYNYSSNGAVTASMLMDNLTDVLNAADLFLEGIPVDRYTFLFHYGEFSSGAWEHSYSSEYVLKAYSASQVRSIGAHEFFHVVTPLNIHSEIIEDFNFTTPTPSKHLWLYEGVTEWAAHMMLFRAGVTPEDTYINNAIEYKVSIDRTYDANYSLVDIALKSYTPAGQEEYVNIYYRGSLVASLLDIRLLELSNGTYGLRELMLELIDTYGADQPFSEEEFFDTITAMTYPEIGDFINNYIVNAEALPYEEYFGKLGFNVNDNGTRPVITPMAARTSSQEILYNAWKQNLQ